MEVTIFAFENGCHREQVVRLWEQVFGYQAAHNNPALVIDRKLAVADGLFFVAVSEGVVVGTIMAGYDGHRGWIYSSLCIQIVTGDELVPNSYLVPKVILRREAA